MGIPKPLVQLNQVFIIITVVLALILHHVVLLLPFIIGVMTLMTKQNPLIRFGSRFLKKDRDQYIQEDKSQQLFNQWIATAALGLAVIFFYLNWTAAGYIFSILVAAAAGAALMGFCIGCTIRYRYIMWKHKRTKTQY
ncbi:DUF4395 domain-containing protein [Alteribacillus sp. HJP-4]|uniref:DUF4395 domain-containing protein n=1 Tax=Alteribacillus sp. HJP-4 TaxID=2775394 RepID=UPI0035CD2D43